MSSVRLIGPCMLECHRRTLRHGDQTVARERIIHIRRAVIVVWFWVAIFRIQRLRATWKEAQLQPIVESLDTYLIVNVHIFTMVLKMALFYEFIITRGSTEQGTEVREAQSQVKGGQGFEPCLPVLLHDQSTSVSRGFPTVWRCASAHWQYCNFNFETQLHELCLESKV